MKVKLYYTENNEKKSRIFNDISSYFQISQKNLPYTSCQVNILTKSFLNSSYEIEVFFKEDLIFSGIIDNQDLSIGESGYHTEIKARSKVGSLLFDNKVKPVAYENITITELVTNHLSQYGITEVVCDDIRRIPSFVVGLNTSPWEVAKAFSLGIYGIEPYIFKNQLVIKNKEGKRVFNIGNYKNTTEENFYNYSRLEFLSTPKNLISKVVLLDENNNEKVYLNDGIKNIERTLYLGKSSSWAIFHRWEARRILSKSKEESKEVLLEIPDFLEISLGDRVILKELSLNEWRVGYVKKNIGRSVSTQVKLYREDL